MTPITPRPTLLFGLSEHNEILPFDVVSITPISEHLYRAQTRLALPNPTAQQQATHRELFASVYLTHAELPYRLEPSQQGVFTQWPLACTEAAARLGQDIAAQLARLEALRTQQADTLSNMHNIPRFLL